MDYLSSFKRLSGVECRLDGLPKKERTGPDPLPSRTRPKSGLSDEQRRLAGFTSPQMRGAKDLTEDEDVQTTFALKRGTPKPGPRPAAARPEPSKTAAGGGPAAEPK